MIGSPNFVRFVYDGDLERLPAAGERRAAGLGPDRAALQPLLRSPGPGHLPTAFDGRSDYGPFITNGIAAGGLFTGAEGIKTEAQEAVFGGVAGLAFDPCYHQACDTFFNLSHMALDQMSDAAAHATWTLAESKSELVPASFGKGQKGKKRGKALKYKGPYRVR